MTQHTYYIAKPRMHKHQPSGGGVALKINTQKEGPHLIHLSTMQMKKFEKAKGSGKKHVILRFTPTQIKRHQKIGGNIFDSIGNFFTKTIPSAFKKVKDVVTSDDFKKGFRQTFGPLADITSAIIPEAAPILQPIKKITGSGVSKKVKTPDELPRTILQGRYLKNTPEGSGMSTRLKLDPEMFKNFKPFLGVPSGLDNPIGKDGTFDTVRRKNGFGVSLPGGGSAGISLAGSHRF